jgi:hypothetical protein
MAWDAHLHNLIHLGAILYLVCFLFRDQIWLRSFAILGDLVYTGYYFVAAGEPLWSAMIYSTLNMAINLFMLAMILRDRRQLPLGDNDLRLYQSFTGMTPGDFRRLTNIGSWHRAEEAVKLTEEGRGLDRLYFVLQGDLEVRKGDRLIPVADRIFIGEIAYLNRVPASATVTAKPGAHFISWAHHDLAKLTGRYETLRQSLSQLLSADMAMKVARS